MYVRDSPFHTLPSFQGLIPTQLDPNFNKQVRVSCFPASPFISSFLSVSQSPSVAFDILDAVGKSGVEWSVF